MYSLILSLGHNSSAILVNSYHHIICGYEEERFSGIKSDSHFPIKSIEAIKNNFPSEFKEIKYAYITHWETFADVNKMSKKHFNKDELYGILGNVIILSNNSPVFTHHDAHMLAAYSYARRNFEYCIVADGFGNFNEVFSLYKNNTLLFRSHGYGKSLGLWYQYTTAFLNMKMNQDEYKLLGYEAYINDFDEIDHKKKKNINEEIKKLSRHMIRNLFSSPIGYKLDALYDIESLVIFRDFIISYWKKVCKRLDMDFSNEKRELLTKVIIAFILQSSIEEVFKYILTKFNIKSVLLSGGLFYNVKLNHLICENVDEICVYPWAGDQGAGLGVYQYHNNHQLIIDDLCIGKRDLSDIQESENLFVYDNIFSSYGPCIDMLRQDKIINLVYDNMEFGPRALGHTSSLMLPSSENVDYINSVNNRNTIMPCAPIVTSLDYFDESEVNKIHKSYEHMIITIKYKKDMDIDKIRGAAHKHPTENYYTGRPQFIRQLHPLYPIVNQFGILINTSFNIHGTPIVNTKDQIIDAHNFQQKRDMLDKIRTVVIRG